MGMPLSQRLSFIFYWRILRREAVKVELPSRKMKPSGQTIAKEFWRLIEGRWERFIEI